MSRADGASLQVQCPGGPRHVRRWLPREGARVRGRVVVVHGLGEHGGRYGETAGALVRAGWGVVAHDQLGHGRSPGRRGVLRRFEDLVDDLGGVLERAGELVPGDGPTVLLGHSMGGLVALRGAQTRDLPIGGLVLSAPWLGEVRAMGRWQRRVTPILARLVPRLPVPAPLDPGVLTRDPQEAARRRADPLVHERVSAGLLVRVAEARADALAGPPPAGVPLLLLVPGDDRLLDQEPTVAWLRRHPSPERRLEELPGRRHEPLNDLGRDEVMGLLLDWLASVAVGG